MQDNVYVEAWRQWDLLRIYSHWFKTVDSGAVGRLSQSGAVGRLSQMILGNVGTAAETEKKWALSGHSKRSARLGNAIIA